MENRNVKKPIRHSSMILAAEQWMVSVEACFVDTNLLWPVRVSLLAAQQVPKPSPSLSDSREPSLASCSWRLLSGAAYGAVICLWFLIYQSLLRSPLRCASKRVRQRPQETNDMWQLIAYKTQTYVKSACLTSSVRVNLVAIDPNFQIANPYPAVRSSRSTACICVWHSIKPYWLALYSEQANAVRDYNSSLFLGVIVRSPFAVGLVILIDTVIIALLVLRLLELRIDGRHRCRQQLLLPHGQQAAGAVERV